MKEPLNSYEVSYVVLLNKPNKDIGITVEELRSILGSRRCSDLNKWSERHVNSYRLRNYTVSKSNLIPLLMASRAMGDN